MLNVTAQKSAEGAKAYFARSDYYTEGAELVGHWGGKGAVLLGLSGEVQETAFHRLCDNLHPQTGEQLTKITRDNRRVGYDFTWSAPKTVSVVEALTGDDRITQAFRESIKETMSEMEAELETRVRKKGQDTTRNSGNWCYAEYIHKTSRPVKGVVAPQLHIHEFALNVTLDPIENQWKAAEFRRIKSEGYYWQAVQQARFANCLQALGYSIRRTKDAFEIAGIPQSVIEKYSLRKNLIERVAERLGITDPKIKAKLGATTREAKDHSVPYNDLLEVWDKWLTPNERQTILDVSDAATPRSVVTDDWAHVQFAAEHVFERKSVVDERRLMTLALRHGCGEVTPEGVRMEVKKLRLLRREEKGKTLVTTREIRDEENRVLSFATAGKGTCRPLVSDESIPFKDQELDEQQRRAVELPLRSVDRAMIIKGKAGTGKSKLTAEVVAQIEARGKHVVMVAPTTPAVNVLRDDGFPADTLARLLVDSKMQESAERGFIILDEAGLVGSKSMSQLFAVAKGRHARVLLLGDTSQLASVERGAPLELLERTGKIAVAEVTEIRRQRSREYRDAVKLLAAGKAGEGLDKLDAMGRVKKMPLWDKFDEVAEEYADRIGEIEDKKDRATLEKRMKQAAIICATHAEGAKVSEKVRDELRAREMIGEKDKEDREFRRLVPLQWSQAERGDRSRYDGTETVQFHRNSKKYKAGQRVSAAVLLEQPAIDNAGHFATYRETTIKLAKHDLIRTTAKGKTLDGKHTVGNGSVYMVEGFDRQGNIKLTNGWTLSKDHAHFNHAYVTTDFGAQGRTVEHVMVVVSRESYPAVTKRGFYVDVSRGRASATIYADDVRSLRQVIEQNRPRISATELAAKPRASRWRRMQETLARVRLNTLVAAKRSAQELAAAWRPQEYGYER